jgi:hypothetical protein
MADKDLDRLAVLQAEFEASEKRLVQTNDPDQRREIFIQLRQLIAEIDAILLQDAPHSPSA